MEFKIQNMRGGLGVSQFYFAIVQFHMSVLDGRRGRGR